MDKKIKFNWRNKECAAIIEYNENPGASESGFIIFKNMPFDVELCKGYPMAHAYVDAANLKGYERYCGWIQIIRREDFSDDVEEPKVTYDIDGSDEMIKRGLPYFALGYPAELFDAPCMNLNGSYRLVWTAHTYLVEMPVNRVNGNKINFLAGFEWGYEESVKQQVKISELRILSVNDWNRDNIIISTIMNGSM